MSRARPSRRRGAWLLTPVLVLLGSTAAAQELPRRYAEALQALVSSRNPAERATAAIALGHGFRDVPPSRDPRIAESLESAMVLDPDAVVQVLAAYALCVRGDRRGVARVSLALRERGGVDPQEMLAPIAQVPLSYLYRALGYVGGPEATRFLIETSSAGVRSVRLVAIGALGLVQDDPAAVDAALAALLRDDDPTIRGVAEFVSTDRARRAAK
ncbi:MAG: hypothetical protein HY294_14950 [Candidatus Rokubacteria bacterium]|nr:hypothetical protein [Candidatus Rokubacteria bacterium]